MDLSTLVRAAGVAAELRGEAATEITDLVYDSRRVGPGSLFFCVRGHERDAHEFAPAALEAGAAALVVDHPLDLDAPEVQVADVRMSMAPLAAAFRGDPTAELRMVGVTGTNGKTTTAFLVREILEAAGIRCGLLGTVQQVVGGRPAGVERTTPEAIDLQATFRQMVEAGDVACVMEVSSHALVLGRADAIHWDARVFTNLTQDHLDFHGTMDDYFAAKRLLFAGDEGVSVVNVDDEYGRHIAADAEGELVTFSVAGAEAATLRARDLSSDYEGSSFTCEAPEGPVAVRTRLPGRFNAENALAALAACRALGVAPADAAAALGRADQIPGRFEPIDEGQDFGVLVDYAHTPDSLKNVLEAARPLTGGRLISVFGCGGDRDRDKRPKMGRIGAELSDLTFVTSDNPRSEEPEEIIGEILAGIHDRERVRVEPDRRAAIAAALGEARPGELVVIAGKGHEQGQEFEGGRKIPFDDRDVAREELRRLAAGAAR